MELLLTLMLSLSDEANPKAKPKNTLEERGCEREEECRDEGVAGECKGEGVPTYNGALR